MSDFHLSRDADFVPARTSCRTPYQQIKLVQSGAAHLPEPTKSQALLPFIAILSVSGGRL